MPDVEGLQRQVRRLLRAASRLVLLRARHRFEERPVFFVSFSVVCLVSFSIFVTGDKIFSNTKQYCDM